MCLSTSALMLLRSDLLVAADALLMSMFVSDYVS